MSTPVIFNGVTYQLQDAGQAIDWSKGDLRLIQAIAVAAPTGLAVASVGSAPAAAGASVSGATLTLQPADGTHPGVVTTASQTIAGAKTFSNGVLVNSIGSVGASSITLEGSPTDASNAIGVILGATASLADPASRLLTVKNASSTLVGVGPLGQLLLEELNGTLPSGTGVTVNSSSHVTSSVHKVTVTFANIASGTGATKDTTIWTLPAKCKLLRVIADVTVPFTGGTIGAMHLTVGKTAGANEYLLSADVLSGAATFGDDLAEDGASLSAGIGDVNWSGTQVLSARWTATVDTVNHCTAGSVTFYIETVGYP